VVDEVARVHEHSVPAGDKEREEGEARGDRGGGSGERRDQPRRQGVRLHVVHAEEGDLPGDREAFGRVQTGHQVRLHAGAASDGDEVRAGAQGCAVAAGIVNRNRVGPVYKAPGLFGQALEGAVDEEAEGLLV